MDLLIPMIVIAGAPKAHRASLVEQLLPLALPGPRAQGLAVAAMTAEQQIRRQEQREQSLVAEAIRAGEISGPADLAAYPALDAAFKRLSPAAQAAVFVATPSTTRKRGAEPT